MTKSVTLSSACAELVEVSKGGYRCLLMPVVVMMLVNCQRACLAKKRKIFGMLMHRFRRAMAADVVINAKDQIGFLHHGVKVVRDQ